MSQGRDKPFPVHVGSRRETCPSKAPHNRTKWSSEPPPSGGRYSGCAGLDTHPITWTQAHRCQVSRVPVAPPSSSKCAGEMYQRGLYRTTASAPGVGLAGGGGRAPGLRLLGSRARAGQGVHQVQQRGLLRVGAVLLRQAG